MKKAISLIDIGKRIAAVSVSFCISIVNADVWVVLRRSINEMRGTSDDVRFTMYDVRFRVSGDVRCTMLDVLCTMLDV